MNDEVLPDELVGILYKKLNGEDIFPAEQQLISEWIGDSEHKKDFVEGLNREDEVWGDLLVRYNYSAEAAWQKMEKRIRLAEERKSKIRPLFRWGWAAAILIVLGGGAYFVFDRQENKGIASSVTVSAADIEPGKEGAILTLADGSQVVLDSLGNGLVASQAGSDIILEDGQLAYHQSGRNTDAPVFNTLSTPRGRQFSLYLPDGSRVWMNAATALRYPTRFSSTDRTVEIVGEAYFEVALDKSRPFFVKVGDKASVQVLGTSFNINAYENESGVYTTLIDGAVRVQNKDNSSNLILKVGELATVSDKSGKINVETADIAKVTAWKNGLFNFENESLQTVMKQLERWYDIEVVYEKGIPEIYFVGKMSRNLSLESVLKTLKDSEVKFRMEEGRKLIVGN